MTHGCRWLNFTSSTSSFLKSFPLLQSKHFQHLHPNPSQPIPPTPITSLHPTLPALENVPRQTMSTLLTHMLPRHIPPALMPALMSVPQMLHRLPHPLRLLLRRRRRQCRHHPRPRIPLHHIGRAREQPRFVPLRAPARLPPQATRVAELRGADTAARGRSISRCRIARGLYL